MTCAYPKPRSTEHFEEIEMACGLKDCPIYDTCEQDTEQVIYCRQIEMIKKITQTKNKLKFGHKKIATNKKTVIRPQQSSESEPLNIRH